MKIFIIISFLALCISCASTHPGIRATRYPQVDQIWKQDIGVAASGREYLDEYYALLNSEIPDVILRYPILSRSSSLDMLTATERIDRSLVPIVFIWIDKDRKPYAWQYDINLDGKIESYSGDVRRLNKILDKINK